MFKWMVSVDYYYYISRGRPVCPVCNFDLRTGDNEIHDNGLIASSFSFNPDTITESDSTSRIFVIIYRRNCPFNKWWSK